VPTSFTPFEPLVRQLLVATPDMPATVLAERVGWTGSITWFRDNVRRLRPEHRPVDPSDRLTWLPGDAAQCDLWFPPRRIALEDGSKALLPVLVITCAYSRFIVARMIPTRYTQDLLLGMWELLAQLGRVPRRLIWDNESGIGRGKRHADGVGLQEVAHWHPIEGTPEKKRAAIGCSVGAVIETYDFIGFGTAAELSFGSVFFPESDPLSATLLSFATLGIGFAVRPLGGVIGGYLGDKIGRKPVLVGSLLLMGIATVLIGLLPTYQMVGVRPESWDRTG